MTIEILPARLANQIAAGEVVERPASVIKELVENSIDAGATSIQIDIDKGGLKTLRIVDNGFGIVKDELTLALSRHATSKIKNLTDLESISSMGFRGEALASISSVSRLTITSKPADQATAWQASAQGRDMQVTVQPAAHPNGTTIEVKDLFFNTPARRKFLRTEKTEFNHIDEVVRRIALAHFSISFTLSHNGKMIRQYRAVQKKSQSKDQEKSQYQKRVAMICGKAFMDHAIEVDCQHDGLHLWGWLALPSFSRSQNDLCYSYVNERMMRDKLINHAIRQAYGEFNIADNYPAFVLYLTLDHKEVDVNVHPAKHEVRFHQGRYVHDFIFSVCQNALASHQESLLVNHGGMHGNKNLACDEFGEQLSTKSPSPEHLPQNNVLNTSPHAVNYAPVSTHERTSAGQASFSAPQEYGETTDTSYITPLKNVNESAPINSPYTSTPYNVNQQLASAPVNPQASANYQKLMTPYAGDEKEKAVTEQAHSDLSHKLAAGELTKQVEPSVLHSGYQTIELNGELRLLSLFKLEQAMNAQQLENRWQAGIVSQPLLLPIAISLSKAQVAYVEKYTELFNAAGMAIVIQNKEKIQIRQYPAFLRDQDVNGSFLMLIEQLTTQIESQVEMTVENFCWALAAVMLPKEYSQASANRLRSKAESEFSSPPDTLNYNLSQQLLLNSFPIDLTSAISQLN